MEWWPKLVQEDQVVVTGVEQVVGLAGVEEVTNCGHEAAWLESLWVLLGQPVLALEPMVEKSVPLARLMAVGTVDGSWTPWFAGGD